KRIVKFCPRCEQPYSYVEKRKKNNHTYFYAVHITKIDGKRHFHKCYLGAETYDYVQRMHPEMIGSLTGMVDKERYIKYLESIIDAVSEMELEEEQSRQVIKILEEGIEKLGKQKATVETVRETV
ncbi:MAG: hypothetical protein QW332_06020, partial [Thermoproteota archaeon]